MSRRQTADSIPAPDACARVIRKYARAVRKHLALLESFAGVIAYDTDQRLLRRGKKGDAR